MRLDVMAAAARYGCNHGTIRNLFKRGGIEGRYENVPGSNGSVQRRLTFEVEDLDAVFAGPLAHLDRRVNHSGNEGYSVEPSAEATLLDVSQAAHRYSCSEARIRQNFKAGRLHGEYMMAPGRDGRPVRRLIFRVADLDECFSAEVTAAAQVDAHVARIRATAVPFSDEQKTAIAAVFVDHLKEKRAAEWEDEMLPLGDDGTSESMMSSDARSAFA